MPTPQPQPLPEHIAAGMNMLRTITQHGDWAMAIEAIAAIALVDIQKRQQEHLKRAEHAAEFGDLYARVLHAAGLRPDPRRLPTLGARTRVLITTFALSDGQSASTSIARWVELLDRERFEVRVLSAEELTERHPQLTILNRSEQRSDDSGAGVIRRIRAAGVDVECVSTNGSLLNGALDAIDRARRFRPDVLLAVASPACPIQAAMIAARVAPVQLVMNIGVPLIMPGVDAIVYHNDAKAEDDAGVIEACGVRAHRVATIGTDLRLCDTCEPASRQTLGVPDDAVLLLSVGNVLPKRLMYAGFGQALAQFLRTHPQCWWIGVGGGEFSEVERIFRDAGVESRVRMPGALAEPRGVMKSADILLNEYPEGGGNTVLEAMGCGLPVVAMHAGSGHAERIGAILIGEDAIPSSDVRAYWERVSALAISPEARSKAGARARDRARREFDYSAIVDRYQNIIENELEIARTQSRGLREASIR